MERLYRIILGGAAVVFFACLAYFLYSHTTTLPTLDHPSDYRIDFSDKKAKLVHVLTIDMSATQRVTSRSIQSGEDSIIVIRPDAPGMTFQTNKPKPVFYIFDGVDALFKYTQSTDKIIDATDPIYASLELATVMPRQKKFVHNRLERAGIYSLHFTIPEATLKHDTISANNPRVVGYAILADGTRRSVFAVPMLLSALPQP